MIMLNQKGRRGCAWAIIHFANKRFESRKWCFPASVTVWLGAHTPAQEHKAAAGELQGKVQLLNDLRQEVRGRNSDSAVVVCLASGAMGC